MFGFCRSREHDQVAAHSVVCSHSKDCMAEYINLAPQPSYFAIRYIAAGCSYYATYFSYTTWHRLSVG